MAANVSIGALAWENYASNTVDLIAPITCDLVNNAQYTIQPRGALAGSPIGLKWAAGVVIDNLTGTSPVTVSIGPLVERVPAYQKSLVQLGERAPAVTVTGSGITPALYFYTGTFRGSGNNVNTLASTQAANVATITGGDIDAFFNTVTWRTNIALAPGYNLDNLTISGFYDVLNPTNAGTSLAAGTWHVQHFTYSASALWAHQVAHSLSSATPSRLERWLVSGTWTAWGSGAASFSSLSLNGAITGATTGAFSSTVVAGGFQTGGNLNIGGNISGATAAFTGAVSAASLSSAGGVAVGGALTGATSGAFSGTVFAGAFQTGGNLNIGGSIIGAVASFTGAVSAASLSSAGGVAVGGALTGATTGTFSGVVTAGGVTASGDIATTAGVLSGGHLYLRAGGTIFINGGGVLGITGNYTVLVDPLGNTSLYAGGTDPTNYYQNTTHLFRSRNGVVNFAQLDANAFTPSVVIRAATGTSAVPGISFSGATSTGIYNNSARLGVVSSGAVIAEYGQGTGIPANFVHQLNPVTSNGRNVYWSGTNSAALYADYYQRADTNVAGSILCNLNTLTTSFNTTSDEDMKTIIGAVPAQRCVAVIKALRPIRFRWNVPDTDPVEMIGFGAQSLGRVAPEAASPARGKRGEKGFMPAQRDDTKLIPYLVGALQNALARIEALENPGTP